MDRLTAVAEVLLPRFREQFGAQGLDRAIAALKDDLDLDELADLIQQGRMEELLPLLAAGEIDLIVGRLYPPAVPDGYTREALWEEPISFLARAGRAEKEYLRLFPSLNASFNVRENLIARAAYYTSVGRPNFNQYSGGVTLPDPDAPASNTNRITVNNAAIKAWSAQTVKARVEYYFAGVGQLSFGAFRRHFQNFFGATVFAVDNGQEFHGSGLVTTSCDGGATFTAHLHRSAPDVVEGVVAEVAVDHVDGRHLGVEVAGGHRRRPRLPARRTRRIGRCRRWCTGPLLGPIGLCP